MAPYNSARAARSDIVTFLLGTDMMIIIKLDRKWRYITDDTPYSMSFYYNYSINPPTYLAGRSYSFDTWSRQSNELGLAMPAHPRAQSLRESRQSEL